MCKFLYNILLIWINKIIMREQITVERARLRSHSQAPSPTIYGDSLLELIVSTMEGLVFYFKTQLGWFRVVWLSLLIMSSLLNCGVNSGPWSLYPCSTKKWIVSYSFWDRFFCSSISYKVYLSQYVLLLPDLTGSVLTDHSVQYGSFATGEPSSHWDERPEGTYRAKLSLLGTSQARRTSHMSFLHMAANNSSMYRAKNHRP